MTQPNYEFVANIGDLSPLQHGGQFVFVDKTGTYDPMLEVVEPSDEEGGLTTIYRFYIPKCTYVNGVLSDTPTRPNQPVWFAKDLYSIGQYSGQGESQLIQWLCDPDPVTRAWAYKEIGLHEGFGAFDMYPLEMPEEQTKLRYPQFA